MFSALLFLQFQSVKNRLWQRFKRLRNPRYLVGALIGGLYLVMVGSQSFFAYRRSSQATSNPIPTQAWELIASLALFVVFALLWIVPHARAALVFTEAEIAFLFPAPIRRQTLIHYKLVRSQLAVLFTVGLLTLVFRRTGGVEAACLRAVGYWVVLSTINLHIIGSSFARTMLLERGFTSWQRRVLVLVVLGTAFGAAVFWTGQSLPAPPRGDALNYFSLLRYLDHLARSPALHFLLTPLRWVVRPFLVSDHPAAFWPALGPALGILALHYLWVIRSDVAFEEASIAASQRHAARVTSVREGRGLPPPPTRARRAPFRLAPVGNPAVALLWKNLLSAGQLFSMRFTVVLLGWCAVFGFSLQGGAGHTGWPAIIGSTALALLSWSILLGPQFVRQDFRQDLAAVDLLKTYPLAGWQVALGELLAPALILSVLQWGLILLAAILLTHAPSVLSSFSEEGTAPEVSQVGLAIAAALIVAPLNLVSLLVPNAAALLLPAWFAGPGGAAGPRGIEVVGQRFLFLIGQAVAQLLAVIPPLLAAFVFWTLVAVPLLGTLTGPSATALVAAVVLLAEAGAGLLVLGHWFERFDASRERPA